MEPIYWSVNFGRIRHPGFNFNKTLTAMDDYSMKKYNQLCEELQANPKDSSLIGTTQWDCYWLWIWQGLAGNTYTHHPEHWGVINYDHKSRLSCSILHNV